MEDLHRQGRTQSALLGVTVQNSYFTEISLFEEADKAFIRQASGPLSKSRR